MDGKPLLCILFNMIVLGYCDPNRSPQCGLKAQVFFVVDGSTGVGNEENFRSMMTGIKAITAKLAINSERGFNVGLTKYGKGTADGHWVDLRRHANLYEIYKYMDRVTWDAAEYSYLHKGLWKMNSRFIDRYRGPDDTLIGLVITNAPPTNETQAKYLALKYKSQGIRLLTVAAGTAAPASFLREIASNENSFNYIPYNELQLDENIQLLTDLICDSADLCPKGGSPVTLDPRGCNSFTQCTPGQPSKVGSCGQLFWDNFDLTCKPLHELLTPCLLDPCQEDGGLKGRFNYYKLPGNHASCRASVSCHNGQMASVQCCPVAEIPVNDDMFKCEPETNCSDTCHPVLFQEKPACTKAADPFDPTAFLDGDLKQTCPFGEVFSQAHCECIKLHQSFEKLRCQPELFLTFDGEEIRDNSTINNEGVSLENGTARFDGTSCLRVPYFNNVEWGATLRVEITFKEDSNDNDNRDMEALFSNSGCDIHWPSIQVVFDRKHSKIRSRLITGTRVNLNVDAQAGVWKTVSLGYNAFDAIATLNVTDSSSFTSTFKQLKGNLERVKCDLSIGCGFGRGYFKGLIHEVKVWRCDPQE